MLYSISHRYYEIFISQGTNALVISHRVNAIFISLVPNEK